jgi:hypothetical protein
MRVLVLDAQLFQRDGCFLAVRHVGRVESGYLLTLLSRPFAIPSLRDVCGVPFSLLLLLCSFGICIMPVVSDINDVIWYGC